MTFMKFIYCNALSSAALITWNTHPRQHLCAHPGILTQNAITMHGTLQPVSFLICLPSYHHQIMPKSVNVTGRMSPKSYCSRENLCQVSREHLCGRVYTLTPATHTHTNTMIPELVLCALSQSTVSGRKPSCIHEFGCVASFVLTL